MQFIWECCSFKAYQSQRRYKVVSWKISESWRTYSISVSYYILSQNETKKCLKEIRVSWLSHSNHQPFQWWDVRKIHCYVCCWSLESQYLTDKDQENASLTLGDWLQKTNGYFRIETWNWQETFCFAKQLHRLFSTILAGLAHKLFPPHSFNTRHWDKWYLCQSDINVVTSCFLVCRKLTARCTIHRHGAPLQNDQDILFMMVKDKCWHAFIPLDYLLMQHKWREMFMLPLTARHLLTSNCLNFNRDDQMAHSF